VKLQNINPTDPIKLKQTSQVSFSGYKNDYDPEGEEVIKFFAPPGSKDAKLEYTLLKKVGQDWVQAQSNESDFEEMEDDGTLLVPKEEFSKNGSDRAFGYRFVVNGKQVSDPGVKSKEGYNVLLANALGVSKKGPMYHVFPDSYYNTVWKSDDPQEEVLKVRNHYNIAGGDIKGMIDRLQNGYLDSYGLIISTPLFGKDEISSHGYWTTNPYQISGLKGDLQDFKDLNVELFSRGKQFVADGAFTSQGFQSPLLQHALKWGTDSPYYNWFKFDYTGNGETSKIVLGVLPNDETGTGIENASYKVVNASFDENGRLNPKYDKTKPTYVQFYDQRLADEAQKADKANLIDKYANKIPDDPYDISSPQDAVWPYSFEINPADDAKLSLLKKFEGKSLGNIENLEELFSFDHFKIGQKSSSGGATFWDGNLDLVKMNLSNANGTDKNKKGSTQAKNYLYNVATYWTKTTHDALLESLALNKGTLASAVAENDISTEEFEAISSAINDDNYQNNLFKDASKSAARFVYSEVMDFPLEAIEVAPDLSAVLASPYVTPSAADKWQVDTKKADLVGNLSKPMQKIYEETVPNFVISVLKKMDAAAPKNKIFSGEDLTEYGKFIARLITPELVTYAFIAGITGKNSEVKEKEINYGDLSQHNIYSTDIVSDKQAGSEGEANKLIGKLTKNMGGLNASVQPLADMFARKYEGADTKSFKLAQAVIEKAGGGLNWRFDAAKDVADLSNTKSHPETITLETSIDHMIDFWTPFITRIKEQNPNSMSIAEITDFWKIAKAVGQTDLGKYGDSKIGPTNAERVFYEKTGATTGSNYSQFFSPLPEIYGQNTEHGSNWRYQSGSMESYQVKWLNDAVKEFLSHNQLPFITNNHIFTDNHDKPRTLHGMALDMGLFLADTDDKDTLKKLEEHAGEEAKKEKETKLEEARQAADEIFAGTDVNISQVSTKGVAVAMLYKEHYVKIVEEEEKAKAKARGRECNAKNLAKALNKADKTINKAIVDIITKDGTVKDGNELKQRSRAFGTRPFEVTIKDVTAKMATQMDASRGAQQKLQQRMLESIMEVPLQKFGNMWELMNALAGVPTIFNGEEYGQTGHETPSKNQELGCRNVVLHNRKDDGSAFSEFYKRINAASNLHNEKGLSALSGGIPTQLNQGSNGLLAIHKYDDRGSEVISVFADVGLDRNNLKKRIGRTQPVGSVSLKEVNAQGEFRCKVYDEKQGKYVDDGATYKAQNGSLTKNGGQIVLKEGANIFYKVPAGKVPFKGTCQSARFRAETGRVLAEGNPYVNLHNTKYAIPK